MNYYGDKISDNMALTPESFLVCSNVRIGRTGWMDYLGRELPQAFNENTGEIFKVYRSPEELFSPNTIASFEGKSVTNTHPTSNLDVNTAPMTERGHVQNVRRDGDFLVADLFVKDAGLISEIQNDIKREVSSGYDCSWHKIGEGKYEQRDIIGNHVAVVPNGRAGPKIAIMDSKPNETDSVPNESNQKPNTGGKKQMKKVTKQFLTALGFKHYAADAEPEDIAGAMDAMNEEDEKKKDVKDAEPAKEPPKEPAKEPVKEEVKDAGEEIPAWAKSLIDDVKALKSSGSKDAKTETADAVMDACEEDLEIEVKVGEFDPEKDDPEKETKDADLTVQSPEKSGVSDAALKKFVQDMKPIIMAIPDEKTRLETAKAFKSSVQDARSYRAANGYGDILGAVAANKKVAMDSFSTQRQSPAEQAEVACKAWSAAGEKMKGGK